MTVHPILGPETFFSSGGTMHLGNKTALVFGAAGAIGSAVARRFAAEGADVFVSGRSEGALATLAKEVGARHDVVDASDDRAVQAYVARIAHLTGRVDVVFNAVGPRAAQMGYAMPAVELPIEQFVATMSLIAGSQFLTARAAAKHMVKQRSGSIIILSASLTGLFVPFMSGISAACGASEAMSRSLAAELGGAGVRVNCVRAGGMPETRTIQETSAQMARTTGLSPEDAGRTGVTVLQRPLRVDETAALVAYMASDEASGITGQVLNVCAGAIVSR